MADEVAFLPAALSLQETPVHPAPRRLAWGLMVLFVLALVWSIFGEVDIVATAPGRIIVSDRTKVSCPLVLRATGIRFHPRFSQGVPHLLAQASSGRDLLSVSLLTF